MAPRLTFLIFSDSRKKEPRYACLSEDKASHWQTIWAEVSSSAPHFLHIGLSIIPIKWRCLLKVWGPVRRPITTRDCILLKDKSLALVPRQGPEINSRACLWVLPRLRHCPQCWFTNQQLNLFLSSYHPLLILVLGWGEWSASRPGYFTHQERIASNYWRESWVGPTVSIDVSVNKLTFDSTDNQTSDRPAHSAVTVLTELSLLQNCVVSYPTRL
jgi:hypothetical protein